MGYLYGTMILFVSLPFLVMVVAEEAYKNYDVRLAGGDENYGRVEVYYGGIWGRVCNRDWWIEDARVVCRQLGFDPDGATVPALQNPSDWRDFKWWNYALPWKNSKQYGTGVGNYTLDKVNCYGEEKHLSECEHQPHAWHYHCLNEDYLDAIAICKTVVRLKGGKGPHGMKKTKSSGRLEMKIKGKWRAVCYSPMLDQRAAKYFCDLLDIKSKYPIVLGDQFFGPVQKKNMKTWWVDWSCDDGYCTIGYRFLMIQPPRKCDTNQYASLKCHNKEPKGSIPELRFSGGTNHSGTLEIKRFGVWGGVAFKVQSKESVNRAANVACRQMGFEGIESAYKQKNDRHAVITWIFDVFCSGTEEHLMECNHRKWGEPLDGRKSNLRLVFVTCITPLKLKRKTNPYTGELHILLDGWRRVCLEEWDTAILQVACRNIGLEWRYADIIPTDSTVKDSNWFRTGVLCHGYEKTLSQCKPGNIGTCFYNSEIQVLLLTCPNRPRKVSKFSIRLSNTNHGEMTVQVGEEWFPMCNSNWNLGAAMVACSQLGFNPKDGQNLGKKIDQEGRVIVTDMNCTGQEENLSECSYSEWKIIRIESAENTCRTVPNGVDIGCKDRSVKARLVGGPDKYSGYAEVWYKNAWRKICVHIGFPHNRIAKIICNDIGLPGQHAKVYSSNIFGSRPAIPGVRFSCPREKFDLCSFEEINCPEDEYFDLGLTCFDHEPGLNEYLPLKLVGYRYDERSLKFGGLVSYDNDDPNPPIHTICGGETWTIKEAQVVCRQLGYDPANTMVDKFPFLQCIGGDKMFLSNVTCTGDERSLAECSFNQGENVTCPHGLKASVICSKLPVVLTKDGTEASSSGEVEITNLFNGYQTHPVCGSGWDEKDARVVCRQLGLPYENASVYTKEYDEDAYYYGNDIGPWITNVNCKGDEAHLGLCEFELDFTLLDADAWYNSYDYCTVYELSYGYVDFEVDSYNCENKGIAGVICN